MVDVVVLLGRRVEDAVCVFVCVNVYRGVDTIPSR